MVNHLKSGPVHKKIHKEEYNSSSDDFFEKKN